MTTSPFRSTRMCLAVQRVRQPLLAVLRPSYSETPQYLPPSWVRCSQVHPGRPRRALLGCEGGPFFIPGGEAGHCFCLYVARVDYFRGTRIDSNQKVPSETCCFVPKICSSLPFGTGP